MKSARWIILSLLFAAGICKAQTASDANLGLQIEYDSLISTAEVSWWGTTGKSYFIQTTDDLLDGFSYLPIIESGADDVISWGFLSSSDMSFYRIKYVDTPVGGAEAYDFDSDDLTTLEELNLGLDPFAALDLNGNGIPDDWEFVWDYEFAVFPNALTSELTYRGTETQSLYLYNPVTPNSDFTVSLTNNEAGSQVLYTVNDSITGTASYTWTDISSSGTLMADISEDDNAFQEVILSSFQFPFYGVDYDRLYVASNGIITFDSGTTDSGNDPVPRTNTPNAFIALFWDDLDTNDAIADDGGDIYYQQFSDRIIIQYQNVMRDSDSDKTTQSNTFQAVLRSSGIIEVYYETMGGLLTSATVGIEDQNGLNGEQVVYNATYLQDTLAIRYEPTPALFVDVSPMSGSTTTGSSTELQVTFNSYDLAPGTYLADIDIAHTGTGSSPILIPATLEVVNPPTDIEMTSPDEGEVFWSDESIQLRANATDNDFGVERVEFFYNETKIAEDLTASYYHNWNPPAIGTFPLTARAVDQYGAVTISDAINITVLEDSDGDRMDDNWEILYFGNLSQGAFDDFDNDGAVNRLEYDRGTDATDDQDVPNNIDSVVAVTAPVDGYQQLGHNSISISATVSDEDSELDRVDFYYGSTFIGSDTSVSSGYASRSWPSPVAGTHSLIARVIDIYGAEVDSIAITVTILSDSDEDRMEDVWEQSNFGSLDEEASADFDGDGVPNVFEYNHLTNPTDPNSKITFAETQTGDFKYFIVDASLGAETDVRKQTVLAAIQAANDFDVIEVLPGVYNEDLGSLYDRLYIFGSSGARNTIITPQDLNDRALYLRSESVISGLTFSGANPTSTSFDGGAIYMSISGAQTKPRFIGCLFSDNTVLDRGGAIYISSADPVFISCTIAGNLAGEGYGNAIYNTSSSNEITFINTILWNPDTGTNPEISGNTSAITYDHTISRNEISGNVTVDGVDQGTSDLGLAYGYSLSSTSLARDAGNTSSLYADPDMDGEALADGSKDIGADEFIDGDTDGLPDWIETLAGTDLTASGDFDNDFLTNIFEYLEGINPVDPDTDDDGLLDGDELSNDGTLGDTDGYFTEVNNPDSDGDGLSDGWESLYDLDPNTQNAPDLDSDGDGVLDIDEFRLGGNPRSNNSDTDQMPDLYEFTYGLDLSADDSEGDLDRDGLENEIEYLTGTRPDYFDTDFDLYLDGFEYDTDGFDPLVPHAGGTTSDLDDDGLTDFYEIKIGTDPTRPDTDCDGYTDKEEVDVGSWPTVATDYPLYESTFTDPNCAQ